MIPTVHCFTRIMISTVPFEKKTVLQSLRVPAIPTFQYTNSFLSLSSPFSLVS
ncbi:hypothetical protein HanPSC8_Chr08g0341621 [Helianthus annuus]|nr:hypothetical protein HanPSC8_Chr08g0341621 [Helianthus annuus]